jgi:hypothetical protein
MTSIINSSNSNSALINTINASDSKHNPNVYSTKKIYPAAATTYVTTTKSSGSVGANQTIVFDLMKYGIAQQMLLVYSKSGAGATVGALDFLDVIDRVELLSSSKVIDTLTKYDLLSQFSNLDSSQFNIVNKSLLAARTTVSATHKFVVPLVFGFFKDINTNLNLQFNEPMSVRVRWGANIKNGTAGPVAGLEIDETDVYLKLRYKAYNESDFSEILTENYNEPELNQMSTGFYDENASTKKLTAGADGDTVVMDITQPGVKVELKNTDCVNDFYISVKRTDSYGASPIVASGPYQPVQINRIRFTASGQEIFDMEGVELFYSKLCVNGFSILTNTASDLQNVVKIQTGLWEYAGGGTQSNTLSLRELNNPIIEVWFQDVVTLAASPQNYDVVVVEDAVKIYSTTSATGRVMTSLSN